MNQPWIYMCSPSPFPPPTSISTRSLWVFPVCKVQALVSCIQPGLVICFTLHIIHVLMLFSRNIPPSPSTTESKSVLYICVSFSVLHIGLHTKETRSERDTCTPTFIAAPFIIARTWKQPRYPSANEWIRKRWYIYTM